MKRWPYIFPLLMGCILPVMVSGCQQEAPADGSSLSLPETLVSLCGLQLEEACERLGCAEDELEIAAEWDGYTDYYLPDQTPPWEIGEEGSVEITFTVSQSDGLCGRGLVPDA